MTFPRSHTSLNPGVPGFTDDMILGFLHDVVSHVKPQFSVEIGSFFGRSACVISNAIAATTSHGRLLCVDIDHVYDAAFVELPFMDKCINRCGPEVKALYTDFAKLKRYSDCFRLTQQRFPWMRERVEYLVMDGAKLDLSGSPLVDFAYIDGDHAYEAVRADTLAILRNLRPSGVIVFDDYDVKFPGVQRLVHEVRSLPAAEVIGQQYHDIGFSFARPGDARQTLASIAG